MTKCVRINLLSMICTMAFSSLLLAAPTDQDADTVEAAQKQAKLEAEYKQALATADQSRAQATA